MRMQTVLLIAAAGLLAACAEKATDAQDPAAPAAAAPKFQVYEPLVKLVEATRACQTVVHGDCAERKALEDWTTNVWMGRVELSREDRIRAFKTAATLVLDKDEKVRNHAAGVFQLDPFRLHDELAKEPALVEKAFVENLLRAAPDLDGFRAGWLMERIPAFTPAYGLLEATFQAADKCKDKADLYGRILKNFPKNSRLKHFEVTQKYAGDTSEQGLPLATDALAGLLAFDWSQEEAVKICPWLATALPALPDTGAAKRFLDSYYLYRWLDLVERCKVLGGEEHLELLTRLRARLEGLKGIEISSETYGPKHKELQAHFANVVEQLKKAAK